MFSLTPPRRLSAAAIAAPLAVAAFLAPGAANAQSVDRYEFLQVKKGLAAMEEEVQRLRNAVSGGDLRGRLDALEDEISRLTGQIERLEFRQREHDKAAKVKLEDLEYRIIELEGGDPSILFQQEDEGGLGQQGALAPASNAPAASASAGASSGGTLGVITTTATVSGSERSLFDSGVAAVQAGRADEGREILSSFLSGYPDSALVGDAHYWLGESYSRLGDYQTAANRYLDGATLYPGSPRAPESLLKLGMTLSLLGQREVACSTLREVGQRYPNAGATVAQAESEALRANCG